MNRSINKSRASMQSLEHRVLMARIAVFDNPLYVDSDNLSSSESDNVRIILSGAGHTVTPFTTTAAAGFQNALNSNDLLVIPELERGNLSPALDTTTRNSIRSYVQGGGGLLFFGGNNSRGVELVNEIFEFTVEPGSFFAGLTLQTGNIAGTTFVGARTELDPNSNVRSVNDSTLPVNTKIIYAETNDQVPPNPAVVLFRIGLGQMTYLGWDYADAGPVGTRDGGWISVLDRAARQVAKRGGGTITSSVFVDRDKDRIKDAGEPNFGGVKVFADLDRDGVADAGEPTGTSNSSGAFTINSVPAGSVRVRAVTPTGFTRTTPTIGYFDVLLSSGQTKSTGPFGFAPDSSDTDDQIIEAKSIAIGSSAAGSISGSTDVDMFKVTVTAGRRLGFDIDRAVGSTLNSHLRIFSYNASTNTAAELAKNDNGAAPGESAATKESYIAHTFLQAGTYYVGVSGSPNFSYGPVSGNNGPAGSTGGFTIRVNSLTASRTSIATTALSAPRSAPTTPLLRLFSEMAVLEEAIA